MAVIGIASSLHLSAQQPAYFILGEEQFEGVQIYDMIQDQQSNYWFATDEGIFKHDGYSFERIDCAEMIGLSAFGFVINARGTIFCHNLNHQILKIENSVCTVLYELQPDERTSDIHLSITPEDRLLVVAKKGLVFDAAGQVKLRSKPRPNYVGAPFLTAQGTIICHLSSRDSLLEVSANGFQVVHMQGVTLGVGVLRFFRMQGSTFAINVGDKALYAFDEQHYRLSALPARPDLHPEEFLRFYNVQDRLWIASPIAGVRLLGDLDVQDSSAIWFPQHLISKVFQDREGNLLLSTFNHGVIVIPDLDIPDALPIPGAQSITGLRYDPDFGILMGTATGQLLAVKDDKISILSNAGTKPLVAIFSWPGHPLVVFDDGKLEAFDKESGKIHAIGSGSLKDGIAVDRNTIYLAFNTGLNKITWDGKAGFAQSPVPQLDTRCYAIAHDTVDGAIYVATAEGLKVLTNDGSVRDLQFQKERIFANDLCFGDGVLYIATKNQGLLLMRKGLSIGRFQPILAGKKLEFSKLLLHQRQLFATTSAGMIVVQVDGKGFTRLNKANGFGTNKIYDFALDGDRLWLAHARGVQRLRLKALQQDVPAPTIRLMEVAVNDEPLPEIGLPGSFDHTQRKFRFQVATPSLRYRENIVYHYQLQGYEEKWTTAPYMDHVMTYNALAPGDYKFVVKADNQGKMSAAASYSFSISAPLYSQWWFIVLISLVILGAVTLLYARQLRVQRRKDRLLNELNLSRLTAIQSQMNPHFIFNALNSIQDLVLQGDVDNSYTFITKFANLVRRTLNYSDKDFIEFEQEIELLQLYLSLEKLRFKHDFEYTLETDDIDDIQIPPMLIQPFIENALIHGLIHREGPKRLKISFELGETLVCTIEDNGVGREKAREIKARQMAAQESFASAAIRKRFAILNEHFEGQLGFEYEDLMENGVASGTRVTLHIPTKRRF